MCLCFTKIFNRLLLFLSLFIKPSNKKALTVVIPPQSFVTKQVTGPSVPVRLLICVCVRMLAGNPPKVDGYE